MKNIYKINAIRQFASVKEGLILLALTPLLLAFAQLIGKISWDDYPGVLVFVLLWNLVFFLPALYLHLTYYVHNRNTLLTVDHVAKRISITDKNYSFEFAFDDIHLVEKHIGIYFKNEIDFRGRWAAPWTGYGYLKLKLKNGQTYFFSSLMLDVQKTPLPFLQTKYRFWPFIDRQEEVAMHDKWKWIEKERQEKYATYLEKFANLSKKELQEKIDNAKRYEPEAVAASKKLLEINSNDTTPNE